MNHIPAVGHHVNVLSDAELLVSFIVDVLAFKVIRTEVVILHTFTQASVHVPDHILSTLVFELLDENVSKFIL